MDDLSGNKKKKKGEVSMVGAAAVVLAVCICFIVDVKVGIGAILGAAVGFFCWRLLGDSSGQEKKGETTAAFLDTEVLRQNFSIPQNMPVPYAVLDIRGHILMYNEPFAQLFSEMEKADAVVEHLKKNGTGKPHLVEVDGRYFEAMLNQCDVEAENGAMGMVLNMTMLEVTRVQELEKKLDHSETVVGMLFLDNYEEVVDTLPEDRQPLLSAVVDRKLTQFATDANGVMRKLEKDRYIFLISKGDLEALKEKKFDIMQTIREMSVGDHMPMTMSMGIGIGGGSLEEAAPISSQRASAFTRERIRLFLPTSPAFAP